MEDDIIIILIYIIQQQQLEQIYNMGITYKVRKYEDTKYILRFHLENTDINQIDFLGETSENFSVTVPSTSTIFEVTMGYDDLYSKDFALCNISFISPTKEYYEVDIDGVQ